MSYVEAVGCAVPDESRGTHEDGEGEIRDVHGAWRDQGCVLLGRRVPSWRDDLLPQGRAMQGERVAQRLMASLAIARSLGRG